MLLTTYLMKLKSEKSIQRLFDLYRIVVWLCTSIAYLYQKDRLDIGLKAIVAILIGISSIGMISLYSKKNLKAKQILAILLIDFLGALLILIPTGGIYSPFVWYAITPIMMGMLHFKFIKCIEMTLVYYISALCITYVFFNQEGLGLFSIILKRYETIMILLLVGAAMGCWKNYFKLLINANERLNKSNDLQHKMNQMLDSTLEELIYIGSASDYKTSIEELNKEHELLLESLNSNMDIKGIYKLKYRAEELLDGVYIKDEDNLEYGVNAEIKSESNRGKRVEVRETDLLGQEHVLGCFLEIFAEGEVERLFSKKLKFMLKFMINEENRLRFQKEIDNQKNIEMKNKLADELHDHLSQRIFNLSCSVFELKKDLFKKDLVQIQRSVEGLENTIKNIVRELRNTITDLSSIKKGEENVNSRIQDYISEIEFFNSVNINLEMSPNFDILGIDYKKMLYRIFCETIGNSVRHGKAEHIDVKFDLNDEFVKYRIIDDGQGFDIKEVKRRKQRGLGIRNIEKMTKLLEGKISVESASFKGTCIEIVFPMKMGEVV